MSGSEGLELKTVLPSKIMENAGIIAVSQLVNKLGWLWRPTPNDDYGLDGEIEPVFDGKASGKILKAQVRAGKSYFKREDDKSFEVIITENELIYWNSVNVPVLLVVHDPESSNTYWKHIQSYLYEYPEARRSRRIRFNKHQDALISSSEATLTAVANDEKASGRIFRRSKYNERLHSNLLPIIAMPKNIYSAPTTCSNEQDLRLILADFPKPPAVIREKHLWTFSNLNNDSNPLRKACETTRIEAMETVEWTGDKDRRRWLISLMNSCLRKKCAPLGIQFDKNHSRYYFIATDGEVREVEYQSLKKRVKNAVVYPYKSRSTGEIEYWVHWAARLQFFNYGHYWYLQVIPCYVFTEDGHKFVASEQVGRISTIRRSRQRNRSVLGFLFFWREYLSAGENKITIYPRKKPQSLIASKNYLNGPSSFGIEGDKVDVLVYPERVDEIDLEDLVEQEEDFLTLDEIGDDEVEALDE